MYEQKVEVETVQEESYLARKVVETATVAVFSGVKQLGDPAVWSIGLVAGILKGKKSGINAIKTIVVVGAIYNTARYLTEDISIDKSEGE